MIKWHIFNTEIEGEFPIKNKNGNSNSISDLINYIKIDLNCEINNASSMCHTLNSSKLLSELNSTNITLYSSLIQNQLSKYQSDKYQMMDFGNYEYCIFELVHYVPVPNPHGLDYRKNNIQKNETTVAKIVKTYSDYKFVKLIEPKQVNLGWGQHCHLSIYS